LFKQKFRNVFLLKSLYILQKCSLLPYLSAIIAAFARCGGHFKLLFLALGSVARVAPLSEFSFTLYIFAFLALGCVCLLARYYALAYLNICSFIRTFVQNYKISFGQCL
jgi:hypothetical protein